MDGKTSGSYWECGSGARIFTKMNKYIWFPASQKGFVVPSKVSFLTLTYFKVFLAITYFKYIFHINIQLSVTLKSDQDPSPDPHGSALVWLPGFGSGSALRLNAGSGSAQHCLCYASVPRTPSQTQTKLLV